jgi:hypothetical protein
MQLPEHRLYLRLTVISNHYKNKSQIKPRGQWSAPCKMNEGELLYENDSAKITPATTGVESGEIFNLYTSVKQWFLKDLFKIIASYAHEDPWTDYTNWKRNIRVGCLDGSIMQLEGATDKRWRMNWFINVAAAKVGFIPHSSASSSASSLTASDTKRTAMTARTITTPTTPTATATPTTITTTATAVTETIPTAPTTTTTETTATATATAITEATPTATATTEMTVTSVLTAAAESRVRSESMTKESTTSTWVFTKNAFSMISIPYELQLGNFIPHNSESDESSSESDRGD